MHNKQALLIFILAGLVVYFRSLFNPFIWDDYGLIVDNSLVHSLTNLPRFLAGGNFNFSLDNRLVGTYYRPLISIIFTLLYFLFGPNPTPFHLLQLVLHIANGFLVYLIFRGFLGKFISFFLALIFLVHPINVESVVYIADLQEVLFFFFGSLAFLYLQSKKNLSLRTCAITAGLVFLSLLGKESGVVFIFIMVWSHYLGAKPIKKLGIWLAGGFILYIFLRILTVGVDLYERRLFPLAEATFLERLQSVPKIIFYYLKSFFFPLDLSTNQYWVVKHISFNNFFFPLLIDTVIFLLLGFFLYGLIKKRSSQLKTYIFSLGWFLIGLGIHLQIIPLDLSVADRWFYFPQVGLLGMLGIIIADRMTNRRIAILIFSALVVLLGIRTYTRSLDWQSSWKLCSQDIKLNQSYPLEYCLANEYIKQKNYVLAKQHIENSILLAPANFHAWNTLGLLYLQEKNIPQAKEALEKAVTLSRENVGEENLALLNIFYDDAQKGQTLALNYVSRNPGNHMMWHILSLAEYKLGHHTEALNAAAKALSLSPTNTKYQQVYFSLSHNRQLQLNLDASP